MLDIKYRTGTWIWMCLIIDELIKAGCFALCCPIEYVAGKVSLRVQELKVDLETKTKDNVFVHVFVSVQYQVLYNIVPATCCV